MLETRHIDLQQLAEDLHLAAAAGELTRDAAVAFIVHVCGPEMTSQEAARVYRRGDPAHMACSWEVHPTSGKPIPRWGIHRRIWDRLHGCDRNRPVLPELAAAWDEGIYRFASTA